MKQCVGELNNSKNNYLPVKVLFFFELIGVKSEGYKWAAQPPHRFPNFQLTISNFWTNEKESSFLLFSFEKRVSLAWFKSSWKFGIQYCKFVKQCGEQLNKKFKKPILNRRWKVKDSTNTKKVLTGGYCRKTIPIFFHIDLKGSITYLLDKS